MFFGVLPAEKLSSFYKVVDILVLPSLNKTEAFGMVQAEAMLQGTPVIAANLPGVRIPIQMTKMGITIPPNTPSKLTNAILRILSDKENYTNVKLINRAKKIFDPQRTYETIYAIMYPANHKQ